MKKILMISAIAGFFTFMLWAFSYAVAMDVWLASNTATADSLKNLCLPTTSYIIGTSTYTVGNKGVFHGLCINQGVSASSFTVYDSSGAASHPLVSVAASTPMPCSYYDVTFSSGLTYTNGNTANVTILYQCY
jgi:hypothetical protein